MQLQATAYISIETTGRHCLRVNRDRFVVLSIAEAFCVMKKLVFEIVISKLLIFTHLFEKFEDTKYSEYI